MSLALNVLIVEDETPAAEKLQRYLQRYSPDIRVAQVCDSIASTVAWWPGHADSVDLVFMDIQLKDGVSFSIFQQVAIQKPIIFITAYNEYALEAFSVNSIAYLLKPVTFDDLKASLDKFFAFRSQFTLAAEKVDKVKALADGAAKNYKNRFLVKVGDHIRSVTADQVIFFFADGRDVYLVTNQSRKFIIDFTLEALEEVLDPAVFFRANRTYILHIASITDVVMYSNSRLKVSTQPAWDKEIIVSREKVSEFKDWFDGSRT